MNENTPRSLTATGGNRASLSSDVHTERRGRDSNPRVVSHAPLSRRARSTISGTPPFPTRRTGWTHPVGTIGAPGFEPGTSATRTQRSTGLSHAPLTTFSQSSAHQQRTGWDSNPRGLSPTRFPIVRLKPLGHPSRVRNQMSLAATSHRIERPGTRVRDRYERREWDSNPRGLSPNALAGRRHKPLGHPSPGTRRCEDHRILPR